MVGGVAARLVSFDIACYGVGETVAEVNPGVSKTDSCECGRQVHLAPGDGNQWVDRDLLCVSKGRETWPPDPRNHTLNV